MLPQYDYAYKVFIQWILQQAQLLWLTRVDLEG